MMNPFNGVSDCSLPGYTSVGEICSNIFDGNSLTKYLCHDFTSPTGVTITYTLPNYSSTWFNGYRVVSGNDSPSRDPKHWTFLASNDGVTWTLLDEQTRTEAFPARSTAYDYPLRSNNQMYSRFKWVISDNFGDSMFQIAQLGVVANNLPIISGLQYESNTINTSAFIDISLAPISSGYSNYSINPSLPSGVTLNASTGVISGAFESGINSQPYTVSAVNLLGNTDTFVITITVIGCDQPTKASVVIKKTNSGISTHETWTIYDSNNSVLHSGIGTADGTPSTFNLCLTAGVWRVRLTSENNSGWAEGDFLDISYKFSVGAPIRIAHLHLLSGTYEEFSVNTRFEFPAKNNWKYLAGSVPTDWYSATYSDASWQTLTYNPPVQTTQRILLFRKSFSTTLTLSSYKAWTFYFKSKAGVVVYVNGVEVYRDYLPDGPISGSTGPTGGDTETVWRSVSGPISSVSSSITLAVGLFNLNTGSVEIDFDGLFNFRSGSTVPLDLEGSSITTNSEGDSAASQAFDGRYNTRYLSAYHDSKSPAYLQITFPHHKAEFVNKYCVVSSWDAPYHDVADWTIQGVGSGNVLYNMTAEVNVSWEARVQRQCFYISSVTTAYKAIRFTAERNTVIQSSNRYAITEIEFYQENIDAITIPAFAFTTSDYKTYRGVAAAPLECTSPYYRNFKITPPLPTTLSMDSSNGYINGVPTEILPRTQYTVTATSIKGQEVTTNIFITVEVCGGANTLFSLSLTFGSGSANEASWEIKNASGSLIGQQSVAVKWATMNYGFCVPTGTYTFTFADSANDGWGDGSYKITLEDGTLVGSGTVGSGESPKVLQYNIGRIVNSAGNNWKYFENSFPGNNWMDLSFNDNNWASAISESLPPAKGTTQYYRLKFNFSGTTSDMAGLEIGARTYAGMIVYLNGKEIRRVNLPSSGITYNTLATNEFSDYIMVSTVIGSESINLVSGQNIIAIEVHKMNTVPAANKFEALVGAVTNGEYRITQGTYSAMVEKTGSEGVDKLFDNTVQTKFFYSNICVGAWFQWTYKDMRRETINHYTISNANDCNERHPSGWILEATNDGETWNVLHYTDKQYFTEFKQTFTYDFYNPTPYNAYRVTVTECNNPALQTFSYCSNKDIQLSEIGLYTSIIPLSCPAADGFSGAPNNGYGYKNCEIGYQGYQRRACTSGVFSPEPQRYCTLIAPKAIRYGAKSYVFETGKANTIPAPFVIAAEHHFNVSQAIPGITFDKKTGSFSGIPASDFNETTVVVTVYNAMGSMSTDITISSKTPAGGMNGAMITIVVIAVIIIIIFIAVLVFCIYNRTKRTNKNHKKLNNGTTKKPSKQPSSNNGTKSLKV